MLVLASSTILIVAGYFKVHDEVIVPPYRDAGVNLAPYFYVNVVPVSG